MEIQGGQRHGEILTTSSPLQRGHFHGQPEMVPFVAVSGLWVFGQTHDASRDFHMTPQKAQRTPKSSRSRRAIRKKRSQPLLFNGVGSLLAGAALWIASLVMRAEDSTAYAAKALLAPAWMGLLLGIGLLVSHVVAKHRAKVEAEMLLRQHSTFLEPMPRLASKRKPLDKASFPAQRRSSSTAR